MIEDVFIGAMIVAVIALCVWMRYMETHVKYCPTCEKRSYGRYCYKCGTKNVSRPQEGFYPTSPGCGKLRKGFWLERDEYCHMCGYKLKVVDR